MATPIQTLPTNQGNVQAHTTDMSDPLVSDVLNEMEKEVQSAKQSSGPFASHQMQGFQNLPQAPALPVMAYPSIPSKKEWIHVDNLKRVAVCMILSFVLFHPSWIFPQLYERFYRLNFLQSYDMFVRIFLFGLFLYVILTFVPYP